MNSWKTSLLGAALVVALQSFTLPAHAQSMSCAQVRACCDAAGGGARCAQLERMQSVAPQACAAIYQQIVGGLRASGRAVPAACLPGATGDAPVSGASGASSTGATQTAPSDPSATGATAGTAHTPPAGLPPEVTTVAQGTRAAGASDDAPACTVVRVRGQRVQFSDESSLLELRCVGLPGAPARMNGDAASFTVGRAPGGKTITVQWTVLRGGGTLTPNGNTASFVNAAPRDGAEDTEIRVRVAVNDRSGRELGQNTRTVLVRTISRDWTLEVTQRFDATCWETARRSIVVGYSLSCDGLRVPLRINNDGTIRSTSGGSCANTLSRSQPCAPYVSNIQAPPPDVVSAVEGRIDRASGVIDLHLAGVHYGMPTYTANGRTETARSVEFLVPPLMLESVNGSSRTFAGEPGALRGSRSYTIRASAVSAPAQRQ